MHFSRIPDWLHYVFNQYTPAQLQAGYTTREPSLAFSGPHYRQLQWQTRKVAGTGIPASTLTYLQNHYDNPDVRLSPVTIRKLKNFFQRSAYAQVRAVGGTRTEALRSRHSLEKFGKKVSMLVKTAEGIAKAKQAQGRKEVTPEHVMLGLARNNRLLYRTAQDWEQYIAAEKKGAG